MKKKFVDLKKLVTRVWLILWAILGILLIMKYCFNIWYPVVVKNQSFIDVCDYIESRKWLEGIIGGIFYVFSVNVWFLIIIKKKKYSKLYYLIILDIAFCGVYVIKFMWNSTVASLIELSYLIILPIIYNLKVKTFNKKILNVLFPVIIYIIFNLFLLNILLVRNIDIFLTKEKFCIGLIMQLDYYIFLIITYIGVCHMGWWTGGWFFGKSLTELEAMKAEELQKENPDKSLLEEIDKAIEAKKEA